MAKRSGKKRRRRLSLAGIIALDIALFVVFTLVLVLLILVAVPGRHLAAALTDAEQPQQITVLSDNADATAMPVNTTASAESASEADLQPSATPTPEATPEPATGDFSASFPAQDTGAGALLSYQSDTIRIAIRKEQNYGSTYFVADVWVKNIEAFRTAFAKGSYGRGQHEMPLDAANRAHAIFAVSGDYYGARDEGVVVRNGQLYRDVMGNDVCILRNDGTMQVYQKGSFSSIDTIDETVWQAWAFGPALVENGVVSDTSGSKIRVKNPRCAIGYYEPGHYCLIVVDGRQKGYSDGMTLDELAQTFATLGCETAYNLDGGATAMMVFQGAVVNQPTNGGRTSSDIICF